MSSDDGSSSAGALGVGVLAILFSLLTGATALAGGFYVVPTTLELRKGAQSGSFSVINNGDEKLDFKVTVRSWSQEPGGEDAYTDAPEIVFFPRIMTVDAHDQRSIRVGVKGAVPVRERAYRIFVEEIPRPRAGAVARMEQGNVSAAIAFAYRFSIPIFWRPSKVQQGGALGTVEMSRGEVRAVVNNPGNVHVKLPSVIFRGKGGDGRELFSKEVNGWYILQGMSRMYAFTVPPEHCGALAAIEVEARTEKGAYNGFLNVQAEMCSP